MIALAVAAALLLASNVGLAAEVIGRVTDLTGNASVLRASLPPRPLYRADPVYSADQIATGTASLAHILLGGKALLTLRETTTVTFAAESNRAAIDIAGGKLMVNVVRERLRPDESVEIGTPHVRVRITGTIVIVETDERSTTVCALRGHVGVSRVSGGAESTLVANQCASVSAESDPIRPLDRKPPIAPDEINRYGLLSLPPVTPADR